MTVLTDRDRALISQAYEVHLHLALVILAAVRLGLVCKPKQLHTLTLLQRSEWITKRCLAWLGDMHTLKLLSWEIDCCMLLVKETA